MAGLDRKVLNSRRITKIIAPSNPVFSRSFITSFGVAFIKEERKPGFTRFPLLFLFLHYAPMPRSPVRLCHNSFLKL